ncbi:hypothetical protein Smic_06530 [Streptomyces microflavus]|uniref:Uncharacterized protein n=1 Tax=Streptomyces microflavus TaxID=1919 RepID=A0A7J0CK41_STRMI|nr:hypothetical protein Smic_06530 [Streptomyces microflavus]
MFDPVPTARPTGGLALRCSKALLSPWSRFSLLVAVLLAAASTMLLFEPQRLLASGWPEQLTGSGAAMLFGLAYGALTVAFVPRPLLNLAAGRSSVRRRVWRRPSRARCSARASRSCWAGYWARTRCAPCCAASC